jgi:hypothetical protein
MVRAVRYKVIRASNWSKGNVRLRSTISTKKAHSTVCAQSVNLTAKGGSGRKGTKECE